MGRLFLLFLAAMSCTMTVLAGPIYEVKESKVKFRSKAPKELISAASGKLSGVVDVQRRSFAFKISIASFEGFNSPLQRDHFNENYMETSQFPVATFVGKIIEEIDLSKPGSYEVRAKGKLTIHGIAQERIIKCHLNCANDAIVVDSDFMVPLADHDIKIPRIVVAKLATDISVNIHAVLEPK
jgi:polyisoprenoid-binding protein YceI